MAHIVKRVGKKGTTYRVVWRVGGKQVEEARATLAAARALKTRIEGDALDGRPVNPRVGVELLNDYFDTWLPARLVKGRPLRESTRLGYERLWNRNITATIGRRQLRAIRPEAVREWHGQLVSAKGQSEAAKSYRVLHAVLATAEADELVRSNPCRIRGAGQEHADERPMIATSLLLELADVIGLRWHKNGEPMLDDGGEQVRDDRYRALVLLVGFSSTRTGEALGLRRCDVDLLHREVHVLVQAQELKGRGRAVLDYTKNDAGRRTIAIPQLVVEALDDHLRNFTDTDVAAAVFTGPEGTPLRRATFSKAWQAAKRATRAPANLRLYDLRHHAATLTARMPGITTKELMARIGHSSWAAAIRYQHATAERDRAVASFLDEQIAAAEPARKARVLRLAE